MKLSEDLIDRIVNEGVIGQVHEPELRKFLRKLDLVDIRNTLVENTQCVPGCSCKDKEQ